MAISEFRGEYRFLSNFWLVPMLFENDWYTSVESAYQAAKTLDKELREPFLSLNPAESKKLGRTLTIRQDWETVKENVMLSLLRLKFSNPILVKNCWLPETMCLSKETCITILIGESVVELGKTDWVCY